MTDHTAGGSGGCRRDYLLFPGDGFRFGYGLGIRHPIRNAVPPPTGLLARQMGRATAVYLW